MSLHIESSVYEFKASLAVFRSQLCREFHKPNARTAQAPAIADIGFVAVGRLLGVVCWWVFFLGGGVLLLCGCVFCTREITD